ncbi:hypothetical protein EMPS_06386 [Entomortierella parvispora]|uniref:MULE transposase domain-containing protein n=1 Tax=Entomortierella parvispora TaxID=205924 RepID=A0A9P3HCV5_9FUNG|nr:hypothetical protein EMPS_06386 [Entomortierella parvispora]
MLVKAQQLRAASESTKGYVFADRFIEVAAKSLGIDLDHRITERLGWAGQERAPQLCFFVLKKDFEEWKTSHANFLGVEFRTGRGQYIYHGSSRTTLGHHGKDVFKCNRSGHLKKTKTTDGNDTAMIGTEQAVVRKRNRKILRETIKTGCLSEMKCISMSKKRLDGSSVECFEIIYTFEHNHALPESENDTGTKYLSAESREKIKRLLQRGGLVKDVLQRMQMHAKRFSEFGKNRIFRDDIITYQDVYNIYHQMMIKEVERDKDPDLSATMWIEELAKDGYYTCYQSGLYYGFSSPWQLEQLKLNGKIFCFDGTHNVYGNDAQLYTIVVKSHETGFGIPVAFLLTKSTDQEIFKTWFKGLKSRMWNNFRISYAPDYVITDQGNVEICAIKSAFPLAKIHFCAWHVLRAWGKKITFDLMGINRATTTFAERAGLREQVLVLLKTMMYEPQYWCHVRNRTRKLFICILFGSETALIALFAMIDPTLPSAILTNSRNVLMTSCHYMIIR